MKFNIRRVAAHAIDLFVSLLTGLSIFGAIAFIATQSGEGFDINLSLFGKLIVISAIILGYVVTNSYLLKVNQTTLGKMIFGLRINGTKRTSLLLLRGLLPIGMLNILMGLGILALLNYIVGLGPKRKCGHDYLFRTEVVNA